MPGSKSLVREIVFLILKYLHAGACWRTESIGILTFYFLFCSVALLTFLKRLSPEAIIKTASKIVCRGIIESIVGQFHPSVVCPRGIILYSICTANF